jgi:phosphatidylinositol glycan class W
MSGYEYVLQFHGLAEYLTDYQSRDWDSFVSLNKEGIYSTVGYTALFLYGAALRYYLQQGSSSPATPSATNPSVAQNSGSYLLVMRLCLLSLLLWGTTLLLTEGLGQKPSRKMANMTYVTIVLTLSTQVILALCLVDAVFPCPSAENLPPQNDSNLVIHAVNRNAFAVFLLVCVVNSLAPSC